MKKHTVTAIFASDAEKLYGESAVRITVGGYGMRAVLPRLISAARGVPILSVSVTDSSAAIYVPQTDEKRVFRAVCREFPI